MCQRTTYEFAAMANWRSASSRVDRILGIDQKKIGVEVLGGGGRAGAILQDKSGSAAFAQQQRVLLPFTAYRGHLNASEGRC